MQSRLLLTLTLLGLFAIVIGGCAVSSGEQQQPALVVAATVTALPIESAPISSQTEITQTMMSYQASYVVVPLERMITEADVIFLGTVVSISPMRWNQDSGEFWEEEGITTLPYHEIEVAVEAVQFDNVGIGQAVTIMVIGASPTGEVASTVGLSDWAEYRLEIGQKALFFLRQSEIAWRGGTRPFLGFLTAPGAGFLIQGDDELYRYDKSFYGHDQSYLAGQYAGGLSLEELRRLTDLRNDGR